jgi:hypothetical protein
VQLKGDRVVNALLPFTFGLIAILVGSQREPNKIADAPQPLQPLEIQLAKPLKWENGCLDVSLDLVNRSARPVFLPRMGLYIDVSAKLLSSVPEKNGTERWLNLYGASDIVPILNVKPLPPGVADHEGHCVSSTVDVVDPGSQVWREVPVRGKLRISVQYYISDPNQPKPGKKYVATEQPVAEVTTLAVPIPCPDGGCALGCDGPPTVEESEFQLVPNIRPHDPEWMERGNERNKELRNLYPCSD